MEKVEKIGVTDGYPTKLRAVDTIVPLQWSMYAFRDNLYAVLANGQLQDPNERPIVRLQSYCSIGQTLGGALCDCGDQLENSKNIIANATSGAVILNWSHEGRGAGLRKHFEAHFLHQNEGIDSVEAYEKLGLEVDPREYDGEIAIMRELGLQRICLLSNNPRKTLPLEEAGFDVVRMPLLVPENEYNTRQLEVRRKKLGHLIPVNGNGSSLPSTNGNGTH